LKSLVFQVLPVIIILMFSTPTVQANEIPDNATIIIETSLSRLCQMQPLDYELIDTSKSQLRSQIIRVTSIYQTGKNDQLQIDQTESDGKVLSYRLTYYIEPGQPHLFVVATADCGIRVARRIIYQQQKPVFLQQLDIDLETINKQEPINPEIPTAKNKIGIRVATVDSGVNYLLPEIAENLARNSKGKIIGYDFWDLDGLPFDSNPARSVFFPQRHGTQTASLLLKEAPNISLVPYRYPRPDMERMADLIQHSRKNKVRIVAMPLGSFDKDEWLPFYKSAKANPEILFIVSSGNNGIDIDQKSVYPAAFKLGNMLVVSAADDIPRPASRTNWGASSTDILVPAERQNSTDFDGRAKQVSGTSYAVARIAALAARLAQQQINWTGNQLKKAILKMADPSLARQFTRFGLLGDPLVDIAKVKKIDEFSIPIKSNQATQKLLELNIVVLKDSGWSIDSAVKAAKQAADIYAQCQLNLDITLSQFEVSDYLLDFHSLSSRTLIEKTQLSAPKNYRATIYLVRDTLRQEAFGGEAFAESNTQKLPWLKHSAWLIAEQNDPGITLAHELVHILLDNGNHSSETGNLMNDETLKENTQLSSLQCEAIRASRLIQTR